MGSSKTRSGWLTARHLLHVLILHSGAGGDISQSIGRCRSQVGRHPRRGTWHDQYQRCRSCDRGQDRHFAGRAPVARPQGDRCCTRVGRRHHRRASIDGADSRESRRLERKASCRKEGTSRSMGDCDQQGYGRLSTWPTAATTTAGPRSMRPARSSELIPCPARRNSSRRAAPAPSFRRTPRVRTRRRQARTWPIPTVSPSTTRFRPGRSSSQTWAHSTEKGPIIRIQPVPNGTQTLLWGPASAVPPPQVAQSSPLACPMGIAVEPTGNILTTTFTCSGASLSHYSAAGWDVLWMCAAGYLPRIDQANHVQSVVNANAPVAAESRLRRWRRDTRQHGVDGHVYRVVTAGVSQGSTPNWNGVLESITADGSVVWQNIGLGANWLIPFGAGYRTGAHTGRSDRGTTSSSVTKATAWFSGWMQAGGLSPHRATRHRHQLCHQHRRHHVRAAGPIDAPVRSNGQPAGILPSGTTQTTMSLTTDEIATCRYSADGGRGLWIDDSTRSRRPVARRTPRRATG